MTHTFAERGDYSRDLCLPESHLQFQMQSCGKNALHLSDSTLHFLAPISPDRRSNSDNVRSVLPLVRGNNSSSRIF